MESLDWCQHLVSRQTSSYFLLKIVWISHAILIVKVCFRGCSFGRPCPCTAWLQEANAPNRTNVSLRWRPTAATKGDYRIVVLYRYLITPLYKCLGWKSTKPIHLTSKRGRENRLFGVFRMACDSTVCGGASCHVRPIPSSWFGFPVQTNHPSFWVSELTPDSSRKGNRLALFSQVFV